MIRYYPAICPYCGGKGFVTNFNPSTTGNTIKQCVVCNGLGRITVTEVISDNLPDLKKHTPEQGDAICTFYNNIKNKLK